MRGNPRLLTAAGILLALVTAGGGWWLSKPGSPAQTAPATLSKQALFGASFVDSNGQTQALSQWQGKLLVINFWATWCPPCLDEMPELSELQTRYRDAGVVIVGISTDDVVKIREFAKTTPVSYPLLAGDFEAMAMAEGLGNDKHALPYSVIVGRDGTVLERYFGRIDMQVLEHRLQGLLSTSH